MKHRLFISARGVDIFLGPIAGHSWPISSGALLSSHNCYCRCWCCCCCFWYLEKRGSPGAFLGCVTAGGGFRRGCRWQRRGWRRAAAAPPPLRQLSDWMPSVSTRRGLATWFSAGPFSGSQNASLLTGTALSFARLLSDRTLDVLLGHYFFRNYFNLKKK